MADYPLDVLGGKTPLEAARTPNMDWLAQHGVGHFGPCGTRKQDGHGEGAGGWTDWVQAASCVAGEPSRTGHRHDGRWGPKRASPNTLHRNT